jgi:hypothetical protein
LSRRFAEVKTLGPLQLIKPMASKIPGGLLADLSPNGTVRIVLVSRFGGENEIPFTAKNLDAAEIVFMTCRLTWELAAAMRAELERNKVCSLQTSIDCAIVAQFHYARPQSASTGALVYVPPETFKGCGYSARLLRFAFGVIRVLSEIA